mmetsp:Transcript_41481/g.109418  ORF Transcript_41481/g.109418 Transcript_41481/m.109418 type:complete len:91 (-) Transcript_41481:455-727(-)
MPSKHMPSASQDCVSLEASTPRLSPLTSPLVIMRKMQQWNTVSSEACQPRKDAANDGAFDAQVHRAKNASPDTVVQGPVGVRPDLTVYTV